MVSRGDSGEEVRPEPIRVLHVDDEPEFGALVKAYLEREHPRVEVVTAEHAKEGFACVEAENIDCIVSDYDMPEQKGLEFLELVRASYPDMPFILFTGKGSEEIASEAISRGVTDYLQKGRGTEQYEVLGNRILNSVQSYRTEHELERSRAFLARVLDLSPSAVIVLDGAGRIIRSNKLAETTLGLSAAAVTARSFTDADWEIVDEDGAPVSDDALPFKQVGETGKPVYDVEHGIKRPDGRIIWLSINAAPLEADTEQPIQVVAVLSDESPRKLRERQQAETIRQLEGMGRVLSHDLGNALNIADGRLEFARFEIENDNIEKASRSLRRAIDLLADLSAAMQAGSVVSDIRHVDLGAIFDRAWATQETTDAIRIVEPGIEIHADENALLRVFENLIRNGLEHGDSTTTLRVGSLANGFYVEDDGPGIPPADRARIFEPGYTSKADGQGMGLPSIQQIALAHEWTTRVTESEAGGARFEFTNVTVSPGSEPATG